ncbi:dipeptidase [Chungangia koreensis]|uniref:Dipeptidase n=1 Tax=Chungangia koreensis TaxID=752657 RepID=A0ABV8X386_9LACT
MKTIDLHCDVLWKMQRSKGAVDFLDGDLDANLEKLKAGNVMLQTFAIFVLPEVKVEEKFSVAMDQVHYFHKRVLGSNPHMKLIRDWTDIDKLQDGEIGALLSLEGVDAIGNDINKLTILHELGVRSIGLTWNNANLAADGILEERGAGLTSFGKEIVTFNNEHQMFTDVSHLSERSFWDVMEIAKYPIASHSNSKSICPNARNLTDVQAKVMFDRNAMVHVTFVTEFVKETGDVEIGDLIKHIDHFCSIGGIHNIGIGSDFDGITAKIGRLEDASMHPNLLNELLKYYTEEQVKGFAYQNFLDHRPV